MQRFLVLDGYDRAGRAGLIEAGATLAGALYRDLVARYRPMAQVDILHPADTDASLPDLSAYDAMFWTGSSLTIYDDVPAVTRQIELARAAFRLGIPAFGSCWALQLASVAAGGSCRKNPKGREFGLTQQLRLTPAGRQHPVLAGRDAPYCGFTSHFDEVESLPNGTEILVTNQATKVQGAEIHFENGRFFALQYHPEYDFSEIAALAKFRGQGLIAEGFVDGQTGLDNYINGCQQLSESPNDEGLRAQFAATDDVLQAARKHNEIIHWLNLHFPITN
jgi:GMP synthase (glutamine-hydrolysing)